MKREDSYSADQDENFDVDLPEDSKGLDNYDDYSHKRKEGSDCKSVFT